MKSLNKAMIIGRLGADPDMRFTAGARAVTSFRVATDRFYKRGEEVVQETDWHSVVCWDKLAENANEYLKKGSVVYVEGRLHYSSYDDKEYDYKHYKTEIVANVVSFLDSKGKDEELAKPMPPRRAEDEAASEPVDEEVPAEVA